jgi:hypothetical protein
VAAAGATNASTTAASSSNNSSSSSSSSSSGRGGGAAAPLCREQDRYQLPYAALRCCWPHPLLLGLLQQQAHCVFDRQLPLLLPPQQQQQQQHQWVHEQQQQQQQGVGWAGNGAAANTAGSSSSRRRSGRGARSGLLLLRQLNAAVRFTQQQMVAAAAAAAAGAAHGGSNDSTSASSGARLAARISLPQLLVGCPGTSHSGGAPLTRSLHATCARGGHTSRDSAAMRDVALSSAAANRPTAQPPCWLRIPAALLPTWQGLGFSPPGGTKTLVYVALTPSNLTGLTAAFMKV